MYPKNSTECENKNAWKVIDECQTRLNLWLLRDFSLLGRIFWTKMESISRCIFPAYSMAIPNRAIKKKSIRLIWTTSGRGKSTTLREQS